MRKSRRARQKRNALQSTSVTPDQTTSESPSNKRKRARRISSPKDDKDNDAHDEDVATPIKSRRASARRKSRTITPKTPINVDDTDSHDENDEKAEISSKKSKRQLKTKKKNKNNDSDDDFSDSNDDIISIKSDDEDSVGDKNDEKVAISTKKSKRKSKTKKTNKNDKSDDDFSEPNDDVISIKSDDENSAGDKNEITTDMIKTAPTKKKSPARKSDFSTNVERKKNQTPSPKKKTKLKLKSPSSLKKSNESPTTTTTPTKNTQQHATPSKTPDPSNPVANGCIDLVIPPNVSSGNDPSCTVLVQLDPSQASVLDFEGASGAIGRFEAEDDGVTLDFKGYQYGGVIQPGPTAMIISLSKAAGVAKVEAITDEFMTLDKTQDVMAKLDAVVSGDMDGYHVVEEDVNRRVKDVDSGGKGGEKDKKDKTPVVKKRKFSAKKKKK